MPVGPTIEPTLIGVGEEPARDSSQDVSEVCLKAVCRSSRSSLNTGWICRERTDYPHLCAQIINSTQCSKSAVVWSPHRLSLGSVGVRTGAAAQARLNGGTSARSGRARSGYEPGVHAGSWS